jgi:hypothetical protein
VLNDDALHLRVLREECLGAVAPLVDGARSREQEVSRDRHRADAGIAAERFDVGFLRCTELVQLRLQRGLLHGEPGQHWIAGRVVAAGRSAVGRDDRHSRRANPTIPLVLGTLRTPDFVLLSGHVNLLHEVVKQRGTCEQPKSKLVPNQCQGFKCTKYKRATLGHSKIP